jgi:hypothetical protein
MVVRASEIKSGAKNELMTGMQMQLTVPFTFNTGCALRRQAALYPGETSLVDENLF